MSSILLVPHPTSVTTREDMICILIQENKILMISLPSERTKDIIKLKNLFNVVICITFYNLDWIKLLQLRKHGLKVNNTIQKPKDVVGVQASMLFSPFFITTTIPPPKKNCGRSVYKEIRLKYHRGQNHFYCKKEWFKVVCSKIVRRFWTNWQ